MLTITVDLIIRHYILTVILWHNFLPLPEIYGIKHPARGFVFVTMAVGRKSALHLEEANDKAWRYYGSMYGPQ